MPVHPGFVVLQRAQRYGYATEYLGWVLNRDELLHTARDAGLELEREFVLLPEMTIAGAPAPVPADITYNFSTSLGGSTGASVLLKKS